MSYTSENNRMRLKALIDCFGITMADVARICGCSRPLISRIVNQGDRGLNTERIYARLEACLDEIVHRRRKPFFTLKGAPVEVVARLTDVTENATLP